MKIEIQITPHPIESGPGLASDFSGVAGAIADFSGAVRDQENGEAITAIEYEAFSPMAENEMRRILESLAETCPCLAARVTHRVGVIPAGRGRHPGGHPGPASRCRLCHAGGIHEPTQTGGADLEAPRLAP
jgi:molybdopterin synthase catalytic subunit